MGALMKQATIINEPYINSAEPCAPLLYLIEAARPGSPVVEPRRPRVLLLACVPQIAAVGLAIRRRHEGRMFCKIEFRGQREGLTQREFSWRARVETSVNTNPQCRQVSRALG